MRKCNINRKRKCSVIWITYDPRKLWVKDSYTKSSDWTTEKFWKGDKVIIRFPATLAAFSSYSWKLGYIKLVWGLKCLLHKPENLNPQHEYKHWHICSLSATGGVWSRDRLTLGALWSASLAKSVSGPVSKVRRATDQDIQHWPTWTHTPKRK